MLNKIIPTTFWKYSVCLLNVLLVLSILPISSHAREAQSINFYLPFHSKQFPTLASRLQEALNTQGLTNINVVTANYWQQYQQNIRRGEPGVYYAAPHFTAWAIEQHKFKPLFKVKNKLKYVIASKQTNQEIFEIRDLKNKFICTQSALNLDYLLIVDTFEKSLQTAHTHIVKSVIDEMNNPDTQCAAFSVSEHVFKQRQLSQPGHFIRLAQGKEYNNYAITIHPSLESVYATKLNAFLKNKNTLKILSPLFKLTSTDSILLQTKDGDYSVNVATPLKRYWRESSISSND